IYGFHRNQIQQYIEILYRFVVEVIAAEAEIERTGEAGCEPEFLAQVPCVFLRDVVADKLGGAAELRIAEDTARRELFAITVSIGLGEEDPWPRVETIEIFQRV